MILSFFDSHISHLIHLTIVGCKVCMENDEKLKFVHHPFENTLDRVQERRGRGGGVELNFIKF